MIDTVVLKVAAPCNLRCSYCYEYEAGDDSWRRMPKHVGVDVAAHLGRRIREYASSRGLSRFNVMLHGGEPLLVGAAKLDTIVRTLRAEAGDVDLHIGMQTNGVLVDEAAIDLVREHRIMVGVSLDGGAVENRRRLDLRGRPTFDAAVRGYRMLRARAPDQLSGLLAVINVENDPRATIVALCGLAPKQLDLLLPFETHDSLGERREAWGHRLDAWLHEAFDAWFHDAERSKVRIRIFEDALQACVTRRAKTDWFGRRRIAYLVVLTDGSIDVLDHLKVIGSDSSRFRGTTADIATQSIADAEILAAALLDRYGASSLPGGCRDCAQADVCAGGYLPHRYAARSQFDNPSVACAAIRGMFVRAEAILGQRKSAPPRDGDRTQT